MFINNFNPFFIMLNQYKFFEWKIIKLFFDIIKIIPNKMLIIEAIIILFNKIDNFNLIFWEFMFFYFHLILIYYC